MGLVYRLLEECWGHRDGYVFLPRKEQGRWVESGGVEWPSSTAASLKLNPAHDVYFSPLVFSERRRLKGNALPTHVLWADLDEADPLKCALRPSAAWQTTQGDFPHWQALWFLANTNQTGQYDRWLREALPAEQAAQLSRRIAYAEGADKSGWDVTQVLRLPGTYNHKHSPPQRIELLWAERRYYTVAQVEHAYPSVPEVTTHLDQMIATDEADVEQAFHALPMGLQMALERPAGGDRSLEILKLARELLRFRVEVPVAVELLKRSPLVKSKYGDRRDINERLLTTLADALIVGNQ